MFFSDGLLIFYWPLNVVELGSELINSYFALFSVVRHQDGLTPRSEHFVFYSSIATALCMHLSYFIA